MRTPQFRLGFERKIGYSLLGLAAGNLAALVAFSMYAAIGLNLAGFGLPGSLRERLLLALDLAFLLGYLSLISWVIVGLPVVLSLSTSLTARLHWSLAALIGSILGAISFTLPFALMGGCWNPQLLSAFLPFFIAAVVIAGVAFSAYCALVRQALRRAQSVPAA